MSTPPYKLTAEILNQVIRIAGLIGKIDAQYLGKSSPELRKQNKIKTIHSSLKIEGNSLSIDQITAIIENKRVHGPQKDIVEVSNAIQVYNSLKEYNALKEVDFLNAHKNLMHSLISDSGEYRKSGVGIVKGNEVEHLAPPSEMVPKLMKDLFYYLESGEDHDLVKSAVFHYELEFIHPFSDGNGRMGRLWNTLILMNSFPIFEFIPFESIISQNQQDYYKALSAADKSGESTSFIVFMLKILEESLMPFLEIKEVVLTGIDRLDVFLESLNDEFTRKDYMKYFKNISSSTASRDLNLGVENRMLRKIGEKNKTKYKKRP